MNTDDRTATASGSDPSAPDPPEGGRVRTALRRRRVRRAAVVGSYLLLAAALVLQWWGDEVFAANGWLVVRVVLFLAGFAGLEAVRAAVRADALDVEPDERLTAIRDEAYRAAYMVVVLVPAVGLNASGIAWDLGAFDGVAFESRHLLTLGLAWILVAIWLPTSILAWREREV